MSLALVIEGPMQVEGTYTAEEVSHKYDKHPPCNIATCIQALECVCLSMPIQHNVVAYSTESFWRRKLVVGEDFALEVWRVHVVVGLSGGFLLVLCRYR